MAKRNSSYWKERMAALEDKRYSQSTAYYRDLEKQFNEASKLLQMDIERWYNRLANNNGVSYAKAKKLLKEDELEEFKWTVGQYIKAGKENAVDERWLKQLENASAKYHISYLEAMKLQIQQHAELLFTAYDGSVSEFLHNVYSDNYYHTAFEIAKGTGIGSNLTRLDPKKIDLIIQKPWAQDGTSFSDRIWGNKEKLVSKLHTELSQSITRGSDPRKVITNLARDMEVSRSQAGRLIMTESAAIASASQKDCFGELGVEQYQILATLDTRTSDICRDMDGKVFSMNDYEVGVTAPPFHPHCRTTTIPYFDDEFSAMEKRAARDPVTGKYIEVSASMTYKQWYEGFVENNPQAVLMEKMQKNKAADRIQYDKYKEVLGKELPKSLDSFQKLKYTDDGIFRFIKLDYTRRKMLSDNIELRLPGDDNLILTDKKFTNYLFGGDDPRGLAKGKAFYSRLGYNAENWEDLRAEIQHKALFYPSTYKQNNGYGDLYEQKIVLYSGNGKPANVVVGWIHKPDGTTSMTSTYIKEV